MHLLNLLKQGGERRKEAVRSVIKPVLKMLVAGALIGVFAASPVFAAGISPVGQFFMNVRTEATSIWAVAGTVIGLVIGLLGMLMGEHRVKEWGTTATIISVCLLSIESLVAWL